MFRTLGHTNLEPSSGTFTAGGNTPATRYSSVAWNCQLQGLDQGLIRAHALYRWGGQTFHSLFATALAGPTIHVSAKSFITYHKAQ